MPTKPSSKYTVSGRVTNAHGKALEGVIVCAYNQDLTSADPWGQALTDAEGRYKSTFAQSDFKVGGRESSGPDVFIWVFDGDELLGESPATRNADKRITIDLQVDYEQAESNEPARRVQGESLRGITVQAFDRDLRTEQELGQSQTDNRGRIGIFGICQDANQGLANDRCNVRRVRRRGRKALAGNSILASTG